MVFLPHPGLLPKEKEKTGLSPLPWERVRVRA